MDATDLTRLAGVDPKTLRGLETGQRWPRDSSRGKIERALQWEPGTLDRLLAGEEITTDPQEAGVPYGPTDMPSGQRETAVQLVLAMDEVFGRLQSTILSPEVRGVLPPATQGLLDYLDFAGQLAETLAVSITGSGEALARLKREERAKWRAVTWAPPSAEHEAELAARVKDGGSAD